MSTIVSVDLDDLACYRAVHGLGGAAPGEDRLLSGTLPRLLELFAELEVRATFFVIGRTLDPDADPRGELAGLLRRALAQGHELANHSHAHAYDLAAWSGARMHEDLARCDARLRSLGTRPLGFRAPGYGHNERMLLQVASLGYRYDSSSLPSPPYFLAKLGAVGWMRLRGRRSDSRLDNGGAFFGPLEPHFMPSSGLWEVPMSATPGLRFPLIGTTLLGGPAWLQRSLVAQATAMEHLHLELHAIDLADPEQDGLAELVGRQPGLEVPLALRRDRLRALLAERGGGHPILAALGG